MTVFAGGSVTDTAKLGGANAAEATGTVTYTVYARQAVMKYRHWFWQWVADTKVNTGTVTVTAGQVPNSTAVTLPSGVYTWQATYSGDAANQPSSSRLGDELETVVPPFQCGPWRSFDHSCGNDGRDGRPTDWRGSNK